MIRYSRVAATLVALAIVVTQIAQAQPQQNSQQHCVNALNKAVGDIAKVSRKNLSKCLKQASRNQLRTLPGESEPRTAEQCLDADLKEKLVRAFARTIRDEAKNCDPPFPDFGYSDGDAALMQTTFSTGLGLKRKNQDVAGVGISWGKPADGMLRDQFTSEAFYRIQLTQFLAITPDVQFRTRLNIGRWRRWAKRWDAKPTSNPFGQSSMDGRSTSILRRIYCPGVGSKQTTGREPLGFLMILLGWLC